MFKKIKSKGGLLGFIYAYVITPFAVIYCIFSLVSDRASILEKQRELDAINEKIEQCEMENAEYRRILESGGLEAYMGKLAAENAELNYGIPNELRFYDTLRN